MTTTMCEVPGSDFDSVLRDGARSNPPGPTTTGSTPMMTGTVLARVTTGTHRRVARETTAVLTVTES
ncbi:hypothetical protein CLV71_10494 [Actinophytocola oryzae]|uniref:Uncharacterized protein n=1 Tax=Actinophytocola oryzae TaxID=502181 RepID=A0A4R7VUI6_9PSEU|nr:hypothetical protein CLV71_10494 [Actinophytocola oryzae]